MLLLSAPIWTPGSCASVSLKLRTEGVSLEIIPVDRQVFRVHASRNHDDNKNAGEVESAKPSTMILHADAIRGARVHRQGPWTVMETDSAKLVVGTSGVIDVKTRSKPVIEQLRFTFDQDAARMSFHHGPGRFYGSGNEGMNLAGDLTHESGISGVANGWTRVPFTWSTAGFGVLVDDDAPGVWWEDRTGEQSWKVPGASLDAYLIVAPDAYSVLDTYARLTGCPAIPPRWTFGFLQSVLGAGANPIAGQEWRGFQDRNIPLNALLYPGQWSVDDFNFNPALFPNPEADLANMGKNGVHFVPGLTPTLTGARRAYAVEHGWLTNTNDLHFDDPGACNWWWSFLPPLLRDGVSAWWNENAASSFSELILMAKTESDGWRAVDNRRPWSINRGFAPGLQQYGASWTGDVSSTWDALRNQPGTLLNWSLCGIPYCGQNIGGSGMSPTPELYARWMEEAVFVPVMCTLGGDSTKWPWSFGDEALAAAKKAIALRYRLIPYLYSYAASAQRLGAPLMRPLFLEFPKDQITFNLEDEWLLGRDLLAAPVLNPGGKRTVYLPAGVWWDFNSDEMIRGPVELNVSASLDTIPTYVRAGTILPLGPPAAFGSPVAADPLELRLFPGADGQFDLYEDAGDGFDYQNGACSRIAFRWNERRRELVLDHRKGAFPGMLINRRIHIVLPSGITSDVTYTGERLRIHL